MDTLPLLLGFAVSLAVSGAILLWYRGDNEFTDRESFFRSAGMFLLVALCIQLLYLLLRYLLLWCV